MSDWTNLNEIMRDLSVAQGHIVPASLETFSNNQPPHFNIEEETDEVYCKSYGDVDFSKPPDFNLIQEMLSMVINKKETSDDKSTLNSNLNLLSPEFVPQTRNGISITKRNRTKNNVALTSILEAQAKESVKQPDLFNSFSPVNMFKRKSTPTKEQKVAILPPTLTKINNSCQYTPSMVASQYYNKYLANAKLREQIQEDIWSRAEHQMRMIDERKRQRKSSCSSSQSEVSVVSNNTNFSYGMDLVTLLHHRHLSLKSIDDCVVCNIAAKHGYRFDEEVS